MKFALLCLGLTAVCYGQDQTPRPDFLRPLPGHVKLHREFGMPEQPASPVAAPPPAAANPCAHIIVIQPGADVDTAILRPAPSDFHSNMPAFKGMPACPQDVRR